MVDYERTQAYREQLCNGEFDQSVSTVRSAASCKKLKRLPCYSAISRRGMAQKAGILRRVVVC